MKIGLITVYFADYGSYYQAASLQKYLEDSGHQCELINDSIRAVRSPKLALGKAGTAVLPKKIQKEIAKRIDTYRSFLALKNDVNNLKISKASLSIGSLSKNYDCVVVGSDELWSATNPNTRFIPENFGINVACPHISYATSGITLNNPSESMMKKIEMGLKTFKSISVRDKPTAYWVGKILGKEIEVVLDPTLLNPFFVGKKIDMEPYALVYGEHFSASQILAIKEFAKKKNLSLYGVSWKHSWCDRNLELDSASQLQDYFKNCSHAFSSTFHGTIFSIVNHAEFTSFTSELRGKKVECLLEQLGLQNRLYCEDSGISDDSIDYTVVENKLSELRESSKAYLENALRIVQEEV